MKTFAVFGVLLVLAVCQFKPPLVQAETISASGEIKITARVAPTHYVIVDDSDQIIELTSNTEGPADIKIYRNTVKAGNEVALNNAIYASYQEILTSRTPRIGILYKKMVEPARTASSWPQLILLPPQSLSILPFVF